MIQKMLTVSSLIPLPFLNPTCTSESSWFTYCWNLAWSILRITLLAWEMSTIVQEYEYSLVLPFWKIGIKVDFFQSCGHFWFFQICWHNECSTLIASSFRILTPALLEFHHLRYLNWQQCFLRLTRIHILGCLALGEWQHLHGFPGH